MSSTAVDCRPVKSDSRLPSPAGSAVSDQKGVYNDGYKGDGLVDDDKFNTPCYLCG